MPIRKKASELKNQLKHKKNKNRETKKINQLAVSLHYIYQVLHAAERERMLQI